VGVGIASIRHEDNMKTLSRIIMGLALAAPFAITSAVRADDKTSSSDNKQDVTMDQLPKPVKSTVQREGKGKTVESMTKTTDSSGATAYEVKYLAGNKETTIDVAASGKVLDRHVHAVGAESNQINKDTQNNPKNTESNQPNQPSQPNKINEDTQNNPPKNDSKSNDTKPNDTRQNP
jgi:hypothetical protein